MQNSFHVKHRDMFVKISFSIILVRTGKQIDIKFKGTRNDMKIRSRVQKFAA